MAKIGIKFGALSEPLKKQIPTLKRASVFQKIADSITILGVKSYVTEVQVERMRKKLLIEIKNQLESQ